MNQKIIIVGGFVDFLDTVAKEKIEPFIDKSYQASCFVCRCIRTEDADGFVR